MGKVGRRRLERNVECKEKWPLESSWRGSAMGFQALNEVCAFAGMYLPSSSTLVHATKSLASFRWPRLAAQLSLACDVYLQSSKLRLDS